ncbi:MAG: serine/threonine protein kinase [bacterium]
MRKIGDIQLFAEIKRTAFGATYRGMDTVHQQLVLVKTFRRNIEDSDANLAESRFEQEAAIYASIKHPNIVRLLDYGISDEVKYLILELIDGQTLRSLLKNPEKDNGVPPEIAAATLWSMMEGIQELHKNNIIHRDLKPENILIAHDGTVKICDFDLAATDEAPQTSGLTGSPGYLAPEIILGDTITPAVDIFSSGVLLYEMLTGTRPFKTNSVSGEMNASVQMAHLSPTKVNPSIPSELDLLTDKLLAKKADARLSNARQTLGWLEKHIDLRAAKKRQQVLKEFIANPQQYQSAQNASYFIQPEQAPKKHISRQMRFAPAIAGGMLIVILVFAWQFSVQQTNPDALKLQTPELPKIENDMQSNQPENNADTVAQIDEIATNMQPRENRDASLSTDNQPESSSLEMETPQLEIVPLQRQFFIQTNPWSYVFVNDDSLGPTPLKKPLTLLDGKYDLILKNPQFPVLHFPLTVDSLLSNIVTYSLWEHIARLELKINPWAYVYVNNKKYETVTGEKTIFLLPGKYKLRFVHPRLGTKNETIFLQAGENRQVPVNMF